MKRWMLAGLVLAMLFGAFGRAAPIAAQDGPTAGPVREFEVEDGHLIGLSPDGAMYAVAIQATALCVYNAETLEEISCGSLEALDAGLRIEDVVWSPDSTRLAFAEQGFVFGKDGDLWVMDAQSGTVTNVTDDGYVGSLLTFDNSEDDATFYLDVAPAWTPDSQFITFSRSGIVSGERTGNDIAQVAATGGEVETLATVSTTEPGVVYFGTGWAPDGQTFYFSLTHVDSDDPENGIWTYDAATGEIAKLAAADDPELGPLTLLQVSPAGDRLLAWYPQAFGQFTVDAELLRLVDPVTGALEPVAMPDAVPETLRGGTTATFSPDGLALLLLTRSDVGLNQLWVTDLATGSQTMVLDGIDHVSVELGLTPTWGANGNVAFGHGIGAGYLTSIAGIGLDMTPATPVPAATPPASSSGVPAGGPVRTFDLPGGRAVSLSPDGRWLAVAVLPSDALCVYDAETTAEVSCADLTGLYAGLRVEDIVWSPDSTRLAFGENGFRYFKDGDLWVMDAQSGALTEVTDDGYDGDVMIGSDIPADQAYYLDVSPAWTPDSQFITFSRSSFLGGDSRGNTVAQVPAAGGEVETLATVSTTEIGIFYYRAAWSPDGASFYYSVDFPDTDNPDNGIWVLDKATGETRLLAKSDDAELGPLTLREVSPAGDRLLAFYPTAMLSMGYVNRSVLRFVDPATGALSPVPDPAPESEIFGGTWIATFSPDGQYLLQAVGISAESRDFWATNLATGEATMVASDLEAAVPIEYALGPVWASNGLVFVSKSIVGAYFFLIDGAGTGQVAPMTAPPEAAFAVGSDVQTNGIAPIFAGPDAAAPVAGILPPNHVVHILAEPIENDEGIWYPVFDPESQIIGYVQANRLKETE
jgi:Tol biopolymer transport system component